MPQRGVLITRCDVCGSPFQPQQEYPCSHIVCCMCSTNSSLENCPICNNTFNCQQSNGELPDGLPVDNVSTSAQDILDIMKPEPAAPSTVDGGDYLEVKELLINDEEKLKATKDMITAERSRLERIAMSCDKLKHETLRKISALPYREVNQYEGFLQNFKKEYNDLVDGLTCKFHETDLKSKINALHHNILGLNDEIRLKKDHLDAIHESVIQISIRKPAMMLVNNNHHMDEILINFSRDSKFSAGLYLACSTLQDVFKDMMLHKPMISNDILPASSTEEQPTEIGDKDEGTKLRTALTTWSEVSKVHCPKNQGSSLLSRPERTVAETNSPHCYFDIRISGSRIVRVVIRVRPDRAPFMADNFVKLTLGTRGFGYLGCKFFRCQPEHHVVGGDFENQNGTGGYSAFDGSKLFLAEQCPLKDQKGAVRMKGIERTADGRCKVGSQFMIWVGDIDYKEYKYTLVFGEVVQGLKYLQEISRIGTLQKSSSAWNLKEEVIITKCGVL